MNAVLRLPKAFILPISQNSCSVGTQFFNTKVENKNPIVFLEFKIADKRLPKVYIELFYEIVPYTAENFRRLCTGENGVGSKNAKQHYKGSRIHRIIPNVLIQGGDFLNGDGTGGESIYGPLFGDENFSIKHSKGTVSMANAGRDSNHSQFFITVDDTPWLNGEHVAFGKVIQGLGTVEQLSTLGTELCTPLDGVGAIVINDCGESTRLSGSE